MDNAAVRMEPDWEHIEALAAAVLHEEDRAWPAFWLAVAPILETWVKHPRFLGELGTNEEHREDIILLMWEKLQQNDHNKLRAYFGRHERDPDGPEGPEEQEEQEGQEGQDKLDKADVPEGPDKAERPGKADTPDKENGLDGHEERARRGDISRKGHFRNWVWRVLKNTGIDYLRSLPEYRRVYSPRLRPGAARPASRPASTSSRTDGNQSDFDQHWHVLETLRSETLMVRDPVTTETMVHQMLAYLDSSVPRRQVLAVELVDRDKLPLDQIARQLGVQTARAASRIIARGRERMLYRRAVELWSQGYTYDEIAAELGLEQPENAQRMINSAKELLKRHFRA